MAKLVLFLPDGTTRTIPLNKERIVIGRRADNDVCLPFPAVSGEHAAVVTILSDSFLEDLESTNGTLVNGASVQKHFLRDRDQIDIGRQKFVYLADEAADVLPQNVRAARDDYRTFGEQVPKAAAAGAAARSSMVRAGSTMPERAPRASPLAPAPDDPARAVPSEPMVRMPELDALAGPPVLTDQPRPSDFIDVRTSTDRALERMARLRSGEVLNGHVPPPLDPARAVPAADAGRAPASPMAAPEARSDHGHGFPPLPVTAGGRGDARTGTPPSPATDAQVQPARVATPLSRPSIHWDDSARDVASRPGAQDARDPAAFPVVSETPEGWGEGPPTHGSSAIAHEPERRGDAFREGGPDSLSPFTDQGPDTGMYFESAGSPISRRTLDAVRGPASARGPEPRGPDTDRVRVMPREPVPRDAYAPPLHREPEPEPQVGRELAVDYRDEFAPRAPEAPRTRDTSRAADTAFDVDFARMPPLPPGPSPRRGPEPIREPQGNAVREFRPMPHSNGHHYPTLDDDYTTGEPEATPHHRPMHGGSVDTIADSLASARNAEHEELRPPAPRITVLSGASAGRSVLMERDEIVIGRVGLQVAAIDRVGSGYVLRLREGDATPILNGDRVPAVGATLKSGDIFEVAGARLEFLVHR
jgi:hypothetical protein